MSCHYRWRNRVNSGRPGRLGQGRREGRREDREEGSICSAVLL